MDSDFYKNIIDDIKQTIKSKIDDEYTSYKVECLKDLDYRLEMKRNDVVSSVLNGIDIAVSSQEPYSLDPVIVIKVEKKIIVKG